MYSFQIAEKSIPLAVKFTSLVKIVHITNLCMFNMKLNFRSAVLLPEFIAVNFVMQRYLSSNKFNIDVMT